MAAGGQEEHDDTIEPGESVTTGVDAEQSAAPEADSLQSRLEADALAAAESAIKAGTDALDDVEEVLEQDEPATAVVDPDPELSAPPSDSEPSGLDARRTWLLRGLLLANVALMGLVLAIPSPTDTADPTEVAGHGEAGASANEHAANEHATDYESAGSEAFVSPRREPLIAPRDPRFEAAMAAAERGRFGETILHLEQLVQDPSLTSMQRALYCTALATYCEREGRSEEARQWAALASAADRPGTQPEDLLELALRAQREGDAQLMRRSYARFLLMRDQLSPAMLGRVTEVYLRLGDSYRLEARVGADRAATRDEQLLREIEKHNEDLRERHVEKGEGLDGKQFVPYPGHSLSEVGGKPSGGE